MSRALTERIVALAFAAFALAYGLEAQRIDLLFGAEFSPFNARTFPTILAWALGIVALAIAVRPGAAGLPPAFAGLAWPPAVLLSALVILYALLIPYLGFFAASALFLAAGTLLLGERRPRAILATALGVSLALWLILDPGLGIYLDDPLLRALGLQ